MIVRPRPTFLQLFFIMRGSVVPRILPQIFGFAIYSAVILLLARHFQLDLKRLQHRAFRARRRDAVDLSVVPQQRRL
ncbi:bestrophin family ion channel [Mesorhizobium sp.]